MTTITNLQEEAVKELNKHYAEAFYANDIAFVSLEDFVRESIRTACEQVLEECREENLGGHDDEVQRAYAGGNDDRNLRLEKKIKELKR
jgi:hypothetical protein